MKANHNLHQNPQVALEHAILTFWQQEQVFIKSLKNRAGAPEFIFYEGPPTANGQPGIHHMIARAYKDIMLRYKTMRGFLVKRRAGWDTHGLPVEVQVEKALGLKSKTEIENLVAGDRLASIAKFNEQCRASVWQYTQDWQEFTERMGYWLDFEAAYITYEPAYIESLWSIIKQIYDRGLLVKRHKVVPYCPRCGTPLSSHEVAQEYQDVVDRTVYVKFALADAPNTFILAWTTTPWTLPGNVALAVGEGIEYVEAEEDGTRYILAKDLVGEVLSSPAVIKRTFTGKELVGKHYQPLFKIDALASEPKVYTVIAAPFVTTEEGTGIVHTAAMYGVEDYEEALKQGLPRIHTVGPDGRFLDNVPGLAGQPVEAATDDILQHLTANNTLYSETDVKHSYPFCWRCKSRLLYYAKDSWFIEMTKLQDKLIAMNATVNWIPQHLRDGRYGEWLKELRDWAFSRERYWGTPLPIWTNKDEATGEERYIVIGSVAELRRHAVDPGEIGDTWDPHRPQVDKVVLQDQAGRQYHYEGVIADVWFDSGAMPFASGEVAAGRYPADYIAEAVDQTRGWFYTLQAVAALLEKTQSPYQNVISLGHINDEAGKKMSKSLGNIIDPRQAGEEYGMDSIRFYLFAMNQPGLPKRFSQPDLLTSYRKNQQLLINILNYYETYRPAEFVYNPRAESPVVLDRWVIALVNQLQLTVRDQLDAYRITDAARATTECLNDISQWYLRRSRDRLTTDCFNTLTYVLRVFAQVVAPLTPFIAEHVWQATRGEADPISIHLSDWPPAEAVDEAVLASMRGVREIVLVGHSLRQAAKLKVRQPLATVVVSALPRSIADLLPLAAAELNVKTIKVGKIPAGWPTQHVSVADTKAVATEVIMALDTTVTAVLRQEADLRELTRAWQAGRRAAGLVAGQMATVSYQTDAAFTEAELAALGEQLHLKPQLAVSPLPAEAATVTLSDNKHCAFVITG